MKTFPGFDSASPTLRCSPLRGDCMRDRIERKYITAWHDIAAPIASGDLVRFHYRYTDGVVSHPLKQLLVSRAGTWWGACANGTFQVGTLFQPHAIEKVVALSEEALCSTPSWDTYRKASPELAANFAEEAKEVMHEWATQGHIDGVAFPGLPALNYYAAGTFERSPTYRPPSPIEWSAPQ